jgi:hypothetical protein
MKNLPKKIILFLDMTDIHDEAARWKIIDGKPTLPDTQVYDNFNKKKKFLQNNFIVTRSFFHFLNNKIRILRSKIKNNDDVKTSLQAGFTYREILELQGHYKDDIFNIGLNNIKEKITNISNISKKINSEFYLVIYPYAETLVFGQKKFSWEDFGYDLCKKNNCKLVNTFDEFRSYKIKNSNWYSDLYFIGDEHFNAGGNKLLSNELIKKIFIK